MRLAPVLLALFVALPAAAAEPATRIPEDALDTAAQLRDLIWTVPEVLHELSQLYRLRAGDLVFMGTPAGVGPLQPGDRFHASLDGVVGMQGRVLPR